MLDELGSRASAGTRHGYGKAYDAEPTEVEFEQIEPIEIESVARPSLQGQQMELLPSFF